MSPLYTWPLCPSLLLGGNLLLQVALVALARYHVQLHRDQTTGLGALAGVVLRLDRGDLQHATVPDLLDDLHEEDNQDDHQDESHDDENTQQDIPPYGVDVLTDPVAEVQHQLQVPARVEKHPPCREDTQKESEANAEVVDHDVKLILQKVISSADHLPHQPAFFGDAGLDDSVVRTASRG